MNTNNNKLTFIKDKIDTLVDINIKTYTHRVNSCLQLQSPPTRTTVNIDSSIRFRAPHPTQFEVNIHYSIRFISIFS